METKGNDNLKSSSFRLRSPSLNSVRLRRIFDLFDTNHDELITVDELSRALILLGLDTNMNELDSVIKTFIQPGNTGLTFDDFQFLILFQNVVSSCDRNGGMHGTKKIDPKP
ncbi:putative EF-hand domain pair protein CML [Helianthus anomalus]